MTSKSSQPKSSQHEHYAFASSNSTQPKCPNSTSSFLLWHDRLGHPHTATVVSVLKSCNINYNKSVTDFCSSCCMAKAHKLPTSLSVTKYTKPLELIFLDVWGPSPSKSRYGSLYYLSIVDVYSHYPWLYCLKRKYDVHSVFIQFQKLIELQLDCKIKKVQIDGGGRVSSPF